MSQVSRIYPRQRVGLTLEFDQCNSPHLQNKGVKLYNHLNRL